MVQTTPDWNRPYRGVKGIISEATIYVNNDEPDLADTTYEESHDRGMLTLNALFVGEPDETGCDKKILILIDKLENRTITTDKAIETNTKDHRGARLKPIRNRSQEKTKYNMSKITKKPYEHKPCETFGFNMNFEHHFTSRLYNQPERVYEVIGQRPEHPETRHPGTLTYNRTYGNNLTKSLLMAGNREIKEELKDSDYSTLLVHKKTWDRLKWDLLNNHTKMLAISGHQTEMEIDKEI